MNSTTNRKTQLLLEKVEKAMDWLDELAVYHFQKNKKIRHTVHTLLFSYLQLCVVLFFFLFVVIPIFCCVLLLRAAVNKS